jgi:hypothetical protein
MKPGMIVKTIPNSLAKVRFPFCFSKQFGGFTFLELNG